MAWNPPEAYNLNKNLREAREIGNWILYSLDFLGDVSGILALHCPYHSGKVCQ